MVSEGKFRADLYYRINVIQLHIPPLRERKEDIPYLSNHFIEEFNKKMNKEIYSISADALAILKEYDWPGNIRELENILERAFHFCKGNQIKSEDILLDAIDHRQLNRGETQPKISTSNNDLSNRKKIMKDTEKQLIIEALTRTNGNRTEAAKLLNISRSTLYYKLNKYDIKEINKFDSFQ